MNDIRFKKENAGIGRRYMSDDVISGLIFYNTGYLTFGEGHITGFDTVDNGNAYCRKFTNALELEECGIVYTKKTFASGIDEERSKSFLHYHISEFFRMNTNSVLYVMVKKPGASNAPTPVVASDLEVIQTYAGGEIRQCGVANSEFGTTLKPTTLQDVLTGLEERHTPMSCVVTYSGKNESISKYTGTTGQHIHKGYCNFSVLIGCDFNNQRYLDLYDLVYIGCIGACLGALSKASVNESIGWVGKFPLGIEEPALINGNLIKNISDENKDKIHNNQYLFVITHAGITDCYFNDSFTMDADGSDFRHIEMVRTIDKACREIRRQMLPLLCSPLKLDPDSGKMSDATVAYLETEANKPLEEMEKANELSGYKAEIDPDQDVLTTGTVEIVVHNVPMGVMRNVSVKIGFSKSV